MPTEPLHDLKFQFLTQSGFDLGAVQTPRTSPVCNQVSRSFTSNLKRAHSLTLIPGYAFLSGTQWARCSDQAAKELGIDIEDGKVGKRAGEILNELQAKSQYEEVVRAYLISSHGAIKMMHVPPLHEALHRLLQSILLQTWTSFEVLTEDLWKETIKVHSKVAANLQKPIHKYSFRRRDGIREAYKDAFQDDAQIKMRLLHSKINEASLYRNLLVHKQGIVDEKFQIDCTTCYLPNLAAIPINTELKFDGEIIRELLVYLAICGYSLIGDVDNWLVKNP